MDHSFQQYLLSKQTVDDRALNKDVIDALRVNLPPEPITMIEVGAGIGTMLKRLVEWEILCSGEYVLVDGMQENIIYAREWIPQWAQAFGLSVEWIGQDLRLFGSGHDLKIRLECADAFDFIHKNTRPADLLIAHAFLDLLPMPESLEKLLKLTNGLAWLTINFDGVSTLLPEIDHAYDEKIESLYHSTMDTRLSGGDSRIGRRLFEYLRNMEARILAAGASDWVVHANDGKYPAAEKDFLRFVLGFFADSLQGYDELQGPAFKKWLARRHEQIECGELVYIAHQMDFLIRKQS